MLFKRYQHSLLSLMFFLLLLLISPHLVSAKTLNNLPNDIATKMLQKYNDPGVVAVLLTNVDSSVDAKSFTGYKSHTNALNENHNYEGLYKQKALLIIAKEGMDIASGYLVYDPERGQERYLNEYYEKLNRGDVIEVLYVQGETIPLGVVEFHYQGRVHNWNTPIADGKGWEPGDPPENEVPISLKGKLN